MFDGKEFAGTVVTAVQEHIDRSVVPLTLQLAALSERIGVLEARVASTVYATADEISATVAAQLNEAVAKIRFPEPQPGKDGAPGRDGVDGIGLAGGFLNQGGELVFTTTAGIVQPLGRVVGQDGKDGERGLTGEPGKDGAPGRDGKDVDLDVLREAVHEEVTRAVAAWERPKDGTDGKDGEPGKDGLDGKPVDLDLIKQEIARQVAAIERPKDGAPGEKGDPGADGKDGKDADPALIRSLIDAGFLDASEQFTKQFAEFQSATVTEIRASVKDGEPGEPGKDGIPGEQGLIGERGPQGESGAQGIQGLQGERGQVGDPGRDGEQGEPGVPGEKGLPGEHGADGKDADPAYVEEVVTARVNSAVDELKASIDDFRRKAVDETMALVVEKIAVLMPVEIGRAVGSLPRPADGHTPTAEELAGLILPVVQAAVAALPVPVSVANTFVSRDGQLGLTYSNGAVKEIGMVVGRDGKDADPAFILAEIQRAVAAIEKPKDGKDGVDGKNGLDGFGFDDLSVEHDGLRTMTLHFTKGDRKVSFPVVWPFAMARGLYGPDNSYSKGDIVTWAGSTWCAESDELTGKPGDGSKDGVSGWRLFAKAGRPGKDGERGPPGEKGAPGRPGADLTQLGPDGKKW